MPGQQFEDGYVFLYREPYDDFWNDWTAKEIDFKERLYYIRRRGKGGSFFGLVELACDGYMHRWIAAAKYDNATTVPKADIPYLVPGPVLRQARRSFCPTG